MNNIILYESNEAVNYDIDYLDRVKADLQKRVELLKISGIEPTMANIKIINKEEGSYNPQKDKLIEEKCKKLKETESKKILKIIEQFGETALTDGWEEKVDAKVQALKKALLTDIPEWNFENNHYIDYFEIVGSEVKLKQGIDRDFFVKKNSVVLTNESDIQKFEKHKQACQILNELINHPENEIEALSKLFWFNPESKEFEITIEEYDPGLSKVRYMEVRREEIKTYKKDKAYNDAQRASSERARKSNNGYMFSK